LSGYDAHLFVKNLSESIDCSPNTEENYIRFSKRIYANKNGNN